MNLQETADYMNLAKETVRTLLRTNRLAGNKDNKGRWCVSVAAIEQYQNTKGRRLNTKVTYNVKLTHAEYLVVSKFLELHDIEIKKRYVNKQKI